MKFKEPKCTLTKQITAIRCISVVILGTTYHNICIHSSDMINGLLYIYKGVGIHLNPFNVESGIPLDINVRYLI